ncbi:CU044_5270 family protein [Phytohabitans sp. LJ34]|uniref:CU044_5270 family protein n=1 Tax=Phytohabitans sp. LJ34 TaxID=3452217 RepID=UPI003F89B938
MTALHDLGDALAPPALGGSQAEPPLDLRRRVLTSVREPSRSAGVYGRRLALRLGTVGAGAVAVAVLVATNSGPGADPPAGTTLDAARVWELAAQGAAALPAAGPKDRFAFYETVGFNRVLEPAKRYGTRIVPPDLPPVGTLEGPQVTQVWHPLDQTRDGYFKLLAPYNGRAAILGSHPGIRVASGTVKDGTLGFFGEQVDLPTETDGIAAYLYRDSGEISREEADRRAFDRIVIMWLPQNVARPQVQAAVLQAARRIGGVQVQQQAKDAAGRPGVGLIRTDNNVRTELIFDPKDYRFLGYNKVTTVDDPTRHMKAGDIITSYAIKRFTYVEKIKQLP